MIHLDGRHRTNKHESNATPVWHLTRPIECNRITLKSVQLPHSFLTVPESIPDNSLQFQQSGSAAQNVVLTKRMYTGATLASEIQTQVQALGASAFTCTFSEHTLKLTFSFTSTYTMIANDERMAMITGIAKDQVTFSSSTLIPDSQVELAPPNVYLVSSSLGSASLSAPIESRVKHTFTIPLDQDIGSMVSYHSQSHYPQVLDYGAGPKKTIHDIDFRVVDPHNNLIELSTPFCVTLAFE